ncbi:MAG: transposase [Bacteroidetes bacterium]|uniref:Transposase n=1 Tax=Candidatus Gallipaludibacter merdavium TaxID=2840839 RepID=A0A9D9N4W7_9BACT|nr:transposase [Candidatus Gallipaludibacter merdavium]
MCYKGCVDRRTVEVNHRSRRVQETGQGKAYRERGMMHCSNRPIGPEAVFGDIKFNHGFKRFRLKSGGKVKVEFSLVALAHNIRNTRR